MFNGFVIAQTASTRNSPIRQHLPTGELRSADSTALRLTIVVGHGVT
ncbi:hypothetical protein [Coleofasciculus sp. C1-SOL-03]